MMIRREFLQGAASALAPSSHNTQCWKFAIAPDEISILPEMPRSPHDPVHAVII